jgi:hypothetical protein
VYDENQKLVKKKTTTEIRLARGPEIPLNPPFSKGETAVLSRGETTALPPFEKGGRGGIFTYHATFSKKGPAALLSHLELVEHIRRAAARAELPVRFSEGFHPLPKIQFGNGIAVGREVEAEPLGMEFYEPMDPTIIQARLNHELPEGVLIQSITSHTLRTLVIEK